MYPHIKIAPMKTFGFAESPIHLGSVFPYALSVQNTSRLPLMFWKQTLDESPHRPVRNWRPRRRSRTLIFNNTNNQVLELAPIIFSHYSVVTIM